jgi:hypothetical protein
METGTWKRNEFVILNHDEQLLNMVMRDQFRLNQDSAATQAEGFGGYQKGSMAKQDITDAAGTPKTGHVYAVFDGQREAQQAEQALAQRGMQPKTLERQDAAHTLQAPREEAGIVGKLERLVKGIGGESNEAKRYATYLEQGRVVVAVPVADRDTALRIARTLTEHGAYDVTYFSGWSIEYMSTESDAKRGLPTHATTNVDE